MKRLIPSPSMAVSLLALVIALGGAGIAATGGNFILGQNNSATTPSLLIRSGNSEALQVRNLDTGAAATALRLHTANTRPPLAVTSTVRVVKLNADMVDGKHATDFAAAASEGWHYIGAAGEPVFENNWENYDTNSDPNSATWQQASYRIDQNGMVHLGGLLFGGTIGEKAFTLQGKYCPWFFHPYAVLSNNALGRVTVSWIDNDFCAVTVSFGSNLFVSLDGISYRTHTLAQLIAPPPTLATASAGKPNGRRGMPRQSQ